MKTNFHTYIFWGLSIPAIVLSSCSDCPVDLTAKRCENIIEAGQVCQLYKDGKLSSSEAAQKINKLTEELKAVEGKYQKILDSKKSSPQDLARIKKEVDAFGQSTEAKLYEKQIKRATEIISSIAKDFYTPKLSEQEIFIAVENYNKVAHLYYL